VITLLEWLSKDFSNLTVNNGSSLGFKIFEQIEQLLSTNYSRAKKPASKENVKPDVIQRRRHPLGKLLTVSF
jgi:hypothetical protein